MAMDWNHALQLWLAVTEFMIPLTLLRLTYVSYQVKLLKYD
jgi:hypothetical protein